MCLRTALKGRLGHGLGRALRALPSGRVRFGMEEDEGGIGFVLHVGPVVIVSSSFSSFVCGC